MKVKVALLSLAVVGLFTAAVLAADPATISWGTGQPKPGTNTGEIDGSGTYTVDAQNYAAIAVAMQATPVAEGTGGNIATRPNPNGTWGPLTISGLTSGASYHVTASITVKNLTTLQQTVYYSVQKDTTAK
jgi:hypothetical protein